MSLSAPRFGVELAALVPRLRRFGRTLTGHPQDADDLAQLALERAWKRQDQWEPGTRLDSWLFRIMQNAWIDEMRLRQRQATAMVAEDAVEQRHDVAHVDGPLEGLAVRRAVSKLSDDHRVVVGLVLVEGFSYKEAARLLDIPMGTLTSRLARAREQLQAMLSLPETGPCTP